MREYLIASLWAFAEATFFFLIPDIYLTRIALYNLRKAIYACFFAAFSACIGGSVMYLWAEYYPHPAVEFLTLIPAIFPKLITEVTQSLFPHPFYALFVAPLKGIPYKIYAVLFGMEKISFSLFIGISFIARLCRFLFVTLAGGIAAALLKPYVSPKKINLIHLMVWWLIYSLYFCDVVYRFF